MSFGSIDVNEIVHISFHYENGQSRNFSPEQFRNINVQPAYNAQFLFAIVNLEGGRYTIVQNSKNLSELLFSSR